MCSWITPGWLAVYLLITSIATVAVYVIKRGYDSNPANHTFGMRPEDVPKPRYRSPWADGNYSG